MERLGGEQKWLALQLGDEYTKLAEFLGEEQVRAFWEWHRDRMQCIAEELQQLPGVAGDVETRAAIERVLLG
ncbi:hypothetical protein [Streptomyces solincola]|uniref:hypothetical protein n=1 Tax=Streptomyces solincola TaxID=2100817 RepID=UPI0011B24403|nr:hypothetical protein [Streptomyces solincola]